MNSRYLYPSPRSPWAFQVDETHKPLKYKAQSGQSGQSTVSQKFFIKNTKIRLQNVSKGHELLFSLNLIFNWTAWTAWPWPILERGFGSPTSGDSPSIRRTGQGERIRVAAGPVASCLMENEAAPRANDGRSSHAPYRPCNRTHNPAIGSLTSPPRLSLRQRAEVQFAALTVSATVLSADHRSQPVDSMGLSPAGPQSRGLFSSPWRRDARSIGPNESKRHLAEPPRRQGGMPVPPPPPFHRLVCLRGSFTGCLFKSIRRPGFFLIFFQKSPQSSILNSQPPKNGKEKFPS